MLNLPVAAEVALIQSDILLGKKHKMFPIRPRIQQRFNQAECDKIHREAIALRARIAIMMTQKPWLHVQVPEPEPEKRHV